MDENKNDNCDSDNSYDSNSDGIDIGSYVTEEQKKILQEKMREIQAQFKVFNSNQENQKVADVQKQYPDLDEKTILLGLESVNNNELLLMRRFREEYGYLQRLIDMSNGTIPMDKESIKYYDPKKVKDILYSSSSSGDENDDWRDNNNTVSLKRERTVSSTSSSSSDDDSDDSEDSAAEIEENESRKKRPRIRLNDAMQRYEKAQPIRSSPSKPKSKSKSNYKRTNAADDDDVSFGFGCDVLRPTGDQEKDYAKSIDYFHRTNVSSRQLRELGWSEARIKAFQNRFTNPNQYYYRFNDPGEAQETGPWSPRDRCLFLRQLIETGMDYSWGLFARTIPGRVGYQCSNFYRLLIKEGIIIDDNYYIDKNNQLTYRFKTKNTKKPTGNGKKKKRSHGDYFDMDGISYNDSEENCLPGFIDVMTMAEVVKPAISPYGHVLGYDSWVKLLNREPKNTCPFTKQKLNRRQLVKLTMSNIAEYRDKIVQTTGSL